MHFLRARLIMDGRNVGGLTNITPLSIRNACFKTLEEAPIDVLEEYEGNVTASLEDYKAAGDEKKVKELENDLKRVRQLMDKKREK